MQGDRGFNKSCIHSLGVMSVDNVKKRGREQRRLFRLRFVPDKNGNQMLNQLFPLYALAKGISA